MPSRSEMKYSAPPSGAHCGLMFLPPVKARHLLRRSPAGRIDQGEPVGADVERIQSRREPVGGERERRPSGDHAGCRSANGSLVSLRTAEVVRSTTYRSVSPPAIPVNAMALPSGAQVGLKISSTAVDADVALAIAAVGASKIARAGAAGDDRRHREAAAPGVPAPGRVDELQARGVRVGRRAGEPAAHLARRGVGEEEIDREQAALREERDPAPVGADGRARRSCPPGCRRAIVSRPTSCGGEASRRIGSYAARIAACQSTVSSFVVMPSTSWMATRVVAGGCAGPEHLADHTVAPSAGDVRPERVAPAVGEVLGPVRDRRRSAAGSSRPVAAAPRRAATSPCSGSTGPIERYSAMPSMNHSGSVCAPVMPGAESGLVVMSNWNACTSSWPIT